MAALAEAGASPPVAALEPLPPARSVVTGDGVATRSSRGVDAAFLRAARASRWARFWRDRFCLLASLRLVATTER